MDGEPARAVREVVGLDAIDEVAVIVLGQHAGDGMLQVETLAEDERGQTTTYRTVSATTSRTCGVSASNGDELARVRPLERELELRQERVVGVDDGASTSARR